MERILDERETRLKYPIAIGIQGHNAFLDAFRWSSE